MTATFTETLVYGRYEQLSVYVRGQLVWKRWTKHPHNPPQSSALMQVAPSTTERLTEAVDTSPVALNTQG